jgi:hypothetical protein
MIAVVSACTQHLVVDASFKAVVLQCLAQLCVLSYSHMLCMCPSVASTLYVGLFDAAARSLALAC